MLDSISFITKWRIKQLCCCPPSAAHDGPSIWFRLVNPRDAFWSDLFVVKTSEFSLCQPSYLIREASNCTTSLMCDYFAMYINMLAIFYRPRDNKGFKAVDTETS
jgi:hypothetical protein